MALKNVMKPYLLVDAASMGADITSDPFDVTYSDNVGIQLVFIGTPTGVFEVQGSIDYNDTRETGNWSALDFGTAPAASGAADVHLLNINNVPYKKLRVFYDRTSGTGSLSVTIMAKTLGG